MVHGLPSWNSFRVVQLKHLIEEIKCIGISNLANLFPGYFFFLHFFWYHSSIAILESNFLDIVWAKKTYHWNDVWYSEVFDFGAIIQGKYWVTLSQKTQKNYPTSPNVNCTCLIRIVEQTFRRHVTTCTSTILYLELFLQKGYPFDCVVISMNLCFAILIEF